MRVPLTLKGVGASGASVDGQAANAGVGVGDLVAGAKAGHGPGLEPSSASCRSLAQSDPASRRESVL